MIYFVVVAAVAAGVFLVAGAVFGRGEELAPLAPDASPTRLPTEAVRGDDVREVRFQQVLRGYRMAEVDWVLERVAAELDRLDGELGAATGERDRLAARVVELEGGG